MENAHRYETAISENNLKHWGILEAVKEFLQNNVYASTILGNDSSITHDGRYAIISNSPSGFTRGKLLIGESEQADVEGAPGQYGEGMKVSMAVARRAGKECLVSTNGFTVKPELEPSSVDESVRVLTYYIQDNDSTSSGTTFMIECDVETLQQAMLSFAVLSGIREEDTKKATIIDEVMGEDGQVAEMEGGYIYINGVRVYQTPAVFSYNFTDPQLMNRDRTTVDMEKVKGSVVSILRSLEDQTKVEFLMNEVLKDDSLLEAQVNMGWGGYNRELWRKAFKSIYPGKVALATGDDTDTLARYHKFTVLANVPSNWKYFLNDVVGVPYTHQLEEIAERVKMQHKKPSAEEATTLGWAKMLIKKYYGDYGTVKVSEKVLDDFGNECEGLYNRKDNVTWIKKSVLQSKEQTFKVLLHETIHRLTGASDNTAEFTKGWEDACYKILLRGRSE